jgi:hypothetical protein
LLHLLLSFAGLDERRWISTLVWIVFLSFFCYACPLWLAVRGQISLSISSNFPQPCSNISTTYLLRTPKFSDLSVFVNIANQKLNTQYPKMTLSRPSHQEYSNGHRIDIESCVTTMKIWLESCAEIVKSIEDKRIKDERKTKGWSRSSEADPVAKQLFDQVNASRKEIGVAIQAVPLQLRRTDGLLYCDPKMKWKERLMQSSRERTQDLRKDTGIAAKAIGGYDKRRMVVGS